MTQRISLFATCPKGLEGLLQEELVQLGAANSRQTVAGVHFEGTLETAYRACLWSRLANRILLPLAQLEAADAEQLYQGVKAISWLEQMAPDATLAVDFSGQSRAIKNTYFGALKVKDAIVDHIREQCGLRPRVERRQPDIRVNVHLYKEQAAVSLDLGGGSLHQRGYRLQGGAAPLKENLAAALLLRAGWPALAAEGRPLLDPMCGSGTLLIEAALMAADSAPGLLRGHFGVFGWRQHDRALWQALWLEAGVRRKRGLARGLPEIRGYDASPKAVSVARENIQRAGLEAHVQVACKELARFTPPTHGGGLVPGLVITNPPYGERLSDEPTIVHLYHHLGDRLKREFPHWQAAVLTGNPELCKQMGLRAHKRYSLFNGALPCKLLLFRCEPEWFVNAPQTEASGTLATAPAVALSEGARMFANRLRKNLKQLEKWARQSGVTCYRLYDADMPEYAVAIDWYEGRVHVQEYAPPASIPAEKAEQRLRDVLLAIPQVLEVAPEQIYLKQRKRQQGRAQYRKQDDQQRFFEVGEGGCRLLVNLSDYLDTGLFLDHRPVRLRLQREAKGKRFLNLFCYTATATVHAAVGGARNTTSVDMSRTYLNWARRNLALNGLSDALHRMVQADCLQWLKECRETFDLIFLDPPTFSNSKRMSGVLDVQRDHVELIQRCMQCLAPDGLLLFSNNNRRFKLDAEALTAFEVTDITAATLDRDFARNPRIHKCWEIRHRAKR